MQKTEADKFNHLMRNFQANFARTTSRSLLFLFFIAVAANIRPRGGATSVSSFCFVMYLS